MYIDEELEKYIKLSEEGDNEAQNILGDYFKCGYSRKNFKEAVKWYKKSAEEGDCEAQYLLGIMLFSNGLF